VLRVHEALPAFSQRVAKAIRPTLQPLEGGRVALEFESREEACTQLLALGNAAQVVEPDELRDAVIERCRATLRAYRSEAARPRRPGTRNASVSA